jgi:DNA-binding NarL/FixJ family response regulator
LELTPREEQVVGLVARGWTSARISRHLQISERTVRKHLENINDKLGTANRAAAVCRWRGLDPGGR